MALYNFSVAATVYLDQNVSANPANRLADVRYSLQGMKTEVPRVVPIGLAPGETLSFVNVTRTLAFTGSTSFSVVQVAGTDRVRVSGSFGARTARTYGDATTEWTVSRTNNTARLTYTGTGTAPTFNTMQAGDGLTIEQGSAFNPQNWGDFVVTAVGADYVEFQNPVAVSQTVAAKVAVYSSGPVQIGDFLDLQNTLFSEENRGTFKILRVTDSYVEVANANAVPQGAFTGVSDGFAIYSDAYNWMILGVDQHVVVRLNGASGNSVEVEPPTPGDLSKDPGLFIKRGRVYRVDVTNLSSQPVSGFIQLAT